MRFLRLLIVDDEPLIRAGIRKGLSSVDGVEIIAECSSGAEAIATIRSERPDLVLLDIKLQDGTGLDVVEEIGAENMPPVIFATAYDDYAVKAFELSAIDYLLKPFDDARLRYSVERARTRISEQNQSQLSEQLQTLLETRARRWPERLAIKSGEGFDLVPMTSIDWIESANNYVQIHCGTKQYLLAESLTHLEARLDPSKFLRVHRCRIVNLSRVVVVHPMLGGTYEMELRGGVRLGTGKQYKDAIQAILRN